MSEYKTGRVYKIIHNQSDIVYIGSTFNRLNDRFYCHKKNKNTAIGKYFTKYGIENFKIILIKEYKVIDKYHLQMYEQLWMNKIKNININKSFQPLYKQYKKETDREYNERNKEKIKEKKKEYYEKNNEVIKNRANIHYENNKEETKQKVKEYKEKNKERIKEKNKEKIICEVCNLEIRKDSLLRHKKSKKHLQNI